MSEELERVCSNCKLLNGAWVEAKKELMNVALKLQDTHDNVDQMVTHMHHLSKLDAIAGTLVEVKDTLLDAATGRHQIPLEIVKELFAQTRKDVGTNTKILAGVIVLLLAVIGFLLMGEHFGWIRTLANP